MIRLISSLFIVLTSLHLYSIELSKAEIVRISQRVENEFDIEGLRYSPIVLEEQEHLPWRFDANSLYRIYNAQKHIGFLVIDQTKGRYDFFDFMLIYDEEMKLLDVEIFTYRSQHGGQVTSDKWLKAFEGENAGHTYKINADIDAISGATLSARSMVRALNQIGLSLLVIKEEFNK